MDLNRIINVDKQLLGKKLSDAGKIERFNLNHFFMEQNSRQDKYQFTFMASSEYEEIGYDGILIIKDKLTTKIKGFYLVEAKVRNKDFNELYFEKAKYETLKRYKRQLDTYLKANYSDHTIAMMYINFTPTATFLFDISTIAENKLLPKLDKIEMNYCTVNSTSHKIEKDVFNLDTNLAIKYKYKFDPNVYMTYLNEKQKELKLHKEVIKKTYSIF